MRNRPTEVASPPDLRVPRPRTPSAHATPPLALASRPGKPTATPHAAVAPHRQEPPSGFIQPRHGHALNLLAGQLYFGTQASTVRTLLGSCVALALWHPQRRIGAMCHYLLPSRQRGSGPPDARFGDEAIGLLLQAIERSGTRPADFQTHLYGGADTMPGREGPNFNIGERNIAIGCELIDRHGFDLQAVDVGDFVPRTVALDLQEGRIEVRRSSPSRQAIRRLQPR